MQRVTAEVLALLQKRQDRRKAELDAARRDVQFAPADEVLFDTEHTPLPSRSLLSPLWMGSFKVLARTAPNTYRLNIPRNVVSPRTSTWQRRASAPLPPSPLGGDSDTGPPPL